MYKHMYKFTFGLYEMQITKSINSEDFRSNVITIADFEFNEFKLDYTYVYIGKTNIISN